MSEQKPNLDSLFQAASEIESPIERLAFLDRSCGDDHELRKQVELLLQSDAQAGKRNEGYRHLRRSRNALNDTETSQLYGIDRRFSARGLQDTNESHPSTQRTELRVPPDLAKPGTYWIHR